MTRRTRLKSRATSDCRVAELLIQPYEQVKAGQPLLIMSGTEVGSVRNEIDRCQNSVELLEKEFQWTEDTHANISNLLALLEQDPTTEQIEQQFKNKNLGEHRNDLLSAYSARLLANKKTERVQRLLQQGAISGKEADTRQAEFETARAKFNSICEESQFQIKQGLREAEIALNSEKRNLKIWRKKLTALTGITDDSETGTQSTEFEILSPRAGQVVDLKAVESARFETGEEIITIADMTSLWVEAQISQEDVTQIQIAPGDPIAIHVPSLPNQKLIAKVRFLGTSVSPDTLSVPLVAELENADQKLRPGMAVRVDVPLSKSHEAIAIPVGAIQRIEMEPVVFVRKSETSFEVRPVKLAAESGNLIEVTAGLAPGEEIVTEAAFFLKSELLLSEEAE